MCTLCYDEYIAKYIANYNDEYKLTIAHPKMMSMMPNTMTNMCQIQKQKCNIQWNVETHFTHWHQVIHKFILHTLSPRLTSKSQSCNQ